MNEKPFLDQEVIPDAYPSIPQAWTIFGILLVGQLVASPILTVIGKESGLGIFLTYVIGLSIGLAFALWYKSQHMIATHDSYPLIEKAAVPISVYVLVIFAIPIMSMISMPLARLIPIPEAFAESLKFMLGDLDIFHFLTIVVAAALMEEIIFRGIILDGFLKRYAPRKAILYSAFLFSLMHINPAQLPHTFLLGGFIGWVYYRTRSIWPCIWIHFLNNGMAFLALSLTDTIDVDQAQEPDKSALLLAIPIGLTLLYGLTRTLDDAFAEVPTWRDKVPSQPLQDENIQHSEDE